MGGAEGEGGAAKVRGLLLLLYGKTGLVYCTCVLCTNLVYGLGERRGLAAVTVQPDLVLGTLGKGIVDVEIVRASILVEQRHIIADYHCYCQDVISVLFTVIVVVSHHC